MKTRGVLVAALAAGILLLVWLAGKFIGSEGHSTASPHSEAAIVAPLSAAMPSPVPMSSPSEVMPPPSSPAKAGPTTTLAARPSVGTVLDASPVAPRVTQEQSQFRELAKEVMKALPLKEALQNLSDKEVHNTPKVLLQAGKELGRVAEALQANPELKKEGSKFYGACATAGGILSDVRALCLFHYDRLRGELASEGHAIQSLESDPRVPADVRELARLLNQ